jgi:hypothetical protein
MLFLTVKIQSSLCFIIHYHPLLLLCVLSSSPTTTALCVVIIIIHCYCCLYCRHYHPLLLLSELSSLSSTATALSVVPKQGITSDIHVPLTAMSLLARNYAWRYCVTNSVDNSMSREVTNKKAPNVSCLILSSVSLRKIKNKAEVRRMATANVFLLFRGYGGLVSLGVKRPKP